LEAAWFQVRSANDLSILGHVQDASLTHFTNLPSWVPDYSVMLLPNSLSETVVHQRNIDMPGNNGWRGKYLPFVADGDLAFNCPICPAPSLPVQGIIVDIVADTAIFDTDYNLWDVLNLLKDLPHLYWGDIQAYAEKEGLQPNDDDGSLPVIDIENGYLVEYGGIRLGMFLSADFQSRSLRLQEDANEDA
jgi:hypothetical protein